MAYFANGSEGEVLEDQCAVCPIGEKGCPIFHVQAFFNYDQVDKGQEKLRQAMNMLVNDKGLCQMLPMLHQAIEEECANG